MAEDRAPDLAMLDPAPRARLEQLIGLIGCVSSEQIAEDITEALRCYDALLTERAQAAPVLAAVEQENTELRERIAWQARELRYQAEGRT